MSEVNAQLTRKIASLARLRLTDTEVDSYTNQLRDILKYIEKLEEVDVKGIEPLVNPLDQSLVLREDRVDAPFMDAQGRPRVLESAPDVMYDGYKVPPIL